MAFTRRGLASWPFLPPWKRNAMTKAMPPGDSLPAMIDPDDAGGRVSRAILDFVSHIPASKVRDSRHPEAEARRLASRAAQRAALTAGSLALPPGPLGWLTVLPELLAIWKIQAQLVSDIAAAYGRHAELGREQMLWCLFRHTTAQAFRDVAVRMGDRLLFRRLSYGMIERVARQIGVKLSRRALGEGLSRWMPVIGALGVGAYAYYDTGQVAATTIAMMNSGFDTAADGEDGKDDAADAAGKSRHVAAARATRGHGKP